MKNNWLICCCCYFVYTNPYAVITWAFCRIIFSLYTFLSLSRHTASTSSLAHICLPFHAPQTISNGCEIIVVSHKQSWNGKKVATEKIFSVLSSFGIEKLLANVKMRPGMKYKKGKIESYKYITFFTAASTPYEYTSKNVAKRCCLTCVRHNGHGSKQKVPIPIWPTIECDDAFV